MNRIVQLFGSYLGIAIAAFIFMAAPDRLPAQTEIDSSTAGRTYIIAFPDTVGNLYDLRQQTDPKLVKRDPNNDSVFVTIYSPTANSVTITGAGGYSTSFSMAQGGFQTVWLNGNPRAASPICNDVNAVSSKTFRIEAANPVIVYCFMATKFGTEAFTPLPVTAWGKEYYAAAMPGEAIYNILPDNSTGFQKVPKAGPAEILVIAAEDNTKLTIVPNARLDRNPPTTVTLMKGQCYQVQSYVDTAIFSLGNPQPDIGGSYIFANAPIGVISGNTRAQVTDNSGGMAKNSFKNMAIEWLAPIEQHGTQFVYLPTSDNWTITDNTENPDWKRQDEIVRIYATSGSIADPDMTITGVAEIEGLSGSIIRTFNIEHSKLNQTDIGATVPHVYRADHPAQAFMTTTAVVQFDGTNGSAPTVGASYSGTSTYMVEMTPREQWTSVAPYVTPTTPDSLSNYLNIATDSLSRNRITINGKALVIDRPIKGTDLYWTSIPLGSGETGVIRGADSTCRFYAFAYGNKAGMEIFNAETKIYEENIGFMYGYPLAPAHRVHPQLPSGVRTTGQIAGHDLAIEPNPFSASTRIGFTLETGGQTTITIYDRIGSQVATLADGNLAPGTHTISWDATGIPSGVYYCRITSGAWSVTRPVFLAR